MSYAERADWVPRYIGILGAFAFFFMLVFNKAVYKIRFLDWGIGAVYFSGVVLLILVRGKIAKKEALYLALPLMWMLYALFATPFAVDQQLHLVGLSQALILTVLASFSVISVFSDSSRAKSVITITAIIWTALNLMFYLAWLTGSYSYEKQDFAGLFSNRNEFSVQSVILISLVILFAKESWLKYPLIFLNGAMVASSLSTKGFLFFIFVIFYPMYLKVNARKKVLTVILGVSVLFAGYTLIPNIQERLVRFSMSFTSPEQLRQNESAFLRMWLTVEGLKVAASNPVFGIGVDNSRLVLIPPYLQGVSEEGFYSHNNFVEMLLNAGLIGFILYYGPLTYVYFKTKRNHRYFVAIKTLAAFHILVGLAAVQYNYFPTIILYSLIMFLFLYHGPVTNYDDVPDGQGNAS